MVLLVMSTNFRHKLFQSDKISCVDESSTMPDIQHLLLSSGDLMFTLNVEVHFVAGGDDV